MVESIYAKNVPEAYAEGIWKMRLWGQEEPSRNGPVLTCPDPVFVSILNPRERVLFDAGRDANPFFHVMEAVWMFAGQNDISFILPFNKNFRGYADDGTDIMHAAYGHRWMVHFGVNQIQRVVDMLQNDPTTRRAVIGMWDPRVDLEPHNDLPCNTSIMFRRVHGSLDMTVVNRSNDMIWGMLGANAVHMTMLHELVAAGAGIDLGSYHVFTNNLHVYTQMPNFERIWGTLAVEHGAYREFLPMNMLFEDESVDEFLSDARRLISGQGDYLQTRWMRTVALPIYHAYTERRAKREYKHWIDMIAAPDWRIACQEWVKRREELSA